MKRNENGRSMIEMLGVLAIIGVLSVGGIYGYTVAMRKYKANEIAQTLSMLAISARSMNGGAGAGQTGLTLENSGLETNPAGVPVTATAVCDAEDSCTTVTITATVETSDDKLATAVNNLLPTDAGLSGYTATVTQATQGD